MDLVRAQKTEQVGSRVGREEVERRDLRRDVLAAPGAFIRPGAVARIAQVLETPRIAPESRSSRDLFDRPLADFAAVDVRFEVGLPVLGKPFLEELPNPMSVARVRLRSHLQGSPIRDHAWPSASSIF